MFKTFIQHVERILQVRYIDNERNRGFTDYGFVPYSMLNTQLHEERCIQKNRYYPEHVALNRSFLLIATVLRSNLTVRLCLVNENVFEKACFQTIGRTFVEPLSLCETFVRGEIF